MKSPITNDTSEAQALRALMADEDGYLTFRTSYGEVSFHHATTDCGWWGGSWFCRNDGIPKLTIQPKRIELEDTEDTLEDAVLNSRHVERAVALGYANKFI